MLLSIFAFGSTDEDNLAKAKGKREERDLSNDSMLGTLFFPSLTEAAGERKLSKDFSLEERKTLSTLFPA